MSGRRPLIVRSLPLIIRPPLLINKPLHLIIPSRTIILFRMKRRKFITSLDKDSMYTLFGTNILIRF